MRYLFMLLAGCIAGAALGAGFVYVNPLIGSATPKLDDLPRTLRYELPASALAVTHAGRLPVMPPVPEGIGLLWERTVDTSAFGLLVLSADDDEPAAVASRVLMPSAESDSLTRGVIADDLWLITIPGEGTLQIIAQSNVWPLVKDTLLNASVLGRTFSGPREYTVTAGPTGDGQALLVGATGLFAQRAGRALERMRVMGYSREQGFDEVFGALHFIVDPLPAEPEDNDGPGGGVELEDDVEPSGSAELGDDLEPGGRAEPGNGVGLGNAP